jgi:hypothetical protein
MSNSVETLFFIESGFFLDPLLGVSSITFAADPIFDFPTSRPFSFSTAPVDTLSYIYNYELVVPTQNLDIPVSQYVFPENLQVNSQTGLVTWDTKFHQEYQQGEYLFAVRVNQYDLKKNYRGYVIRVFSIFLQGVGSRSLILNPVSDVNGKVIVLPEKQKVIKVILSDTINADTAFWNSYFDPALVNNIAFKQYDSTTATKKIKVGLLTLNSTHEIERDLPYEIILRGFSSGSDFISARDVSFSFFTKDGELPIVTSVTSTDNEISLYPNPCTNEVHLSGSVNNGRVEITNILGQVIAQSTMSEEQTIDTSELLPGIYFLVFRENRGRHSFKMIKK